MTKAFTFPFLMACPLVLWGNACTSAANGNWNSAASWTNCGGGYPVSGDTVTITHNITVAADAAVGNSPLDTINAIPALPVIDIQRTNGTTSNGQLTINSGATLRVKGSIKTTGSYSPQYAPIISINPGAVWIFDNTANPTAVYRFYSQSEDSTTLLNAPGTAWTTGNYVTIYGRDPACSSCTGAIWFSETGGTTATGTGKWVTFRHNYAFTKFYYFGSPTDSYRAMYPACLSSINSVPQQMYMINVEWHNSSGVDSSGSSGYPCAATDFIWRYVKVLDSTTASTRGWWDFRPYGTRNSGTNRILEYTYLDRGFGSSAAANTIFTDFTSVKYIVADGQQNAFGPGTSVSGSNVPNLDHILIHVTGNISDSYFYGSTSYLLTVIDGGVGNIHTVMTRNLSSAYNWIIDHAIFQHGDATGAGDTDAYEMVAGTGQTATWNYMLFLPNAAQPQYTSHTVNTFGASSAITTRYNHATFAFGKDYNGNAGVYGSFYYGEQSPCGSTGGVGIKNSILWNPNPTANSTPVYTLASGTCTLSTVAANMFDPTQIHHNLVWNYSATGSTRWNATAGACGGSNCTSYNTPYDAPMTGTAPGASDQHIAPNFLWQKQGLTAPGPREWAHAKHGADTTTGETATEVHFGTTFALFRDSVINDTATTAGMKGLIDEMFAWIYAEWSSTDPTLKGAADDGSDIGAAPVTILCPGSYPEAVVCGCNGLAQASPPANSLYVAGSN